MVDALTANTAEVARAHEQYLEGAEGMPVQDDQEAREAMAQEAHTPVDNEDLATELNTVDATVGGVTMPVYSGGNIVNDVTPMEMDTLVRDAFDVGEIFETGGQIPPTDYEDAASLSPYVDPAFLMEASKKTGEKYF